MNLKFLTWNVEGKGSPEEIDKALIATPLTPDLVCLQEANLPSDGEDSTHFKWCRTGSYGSAILIKKTLNLKIESFKRYCDQISTADITDDTDIKFKVVSCYIPPSDDYQCEDIWSKLTETIKEIPRSLPFVIAGDFNAQLGKKDRAKVDDLIMGAAIQHDNCNENGVKLKQLAIKAHLKIMSTIIKFVKKEDVTKYLTFKKKDVKGQPNFILMPVHRQLGVKNISNSWYKDFKHAKHTGIITVFTPFNKKAKIEKPKEEKAVDDDEEMDDNKEKEDLNVKVKPFTLSSWNIQSATPANVDSLLKEMDTSSIVCIQELFLTSDEDIQTENFTWLCSKTLWAKNVGILLKKSEDIETLSFEPVSEYLCTGSFVVSGKNWTIVSCQLPPPTDSQHEEVVTQIIGLINGFPEETNFIISGDFGSASIEGNEGLKKITKESKMLVTLQLPMFVKLQLKKQIFTHVRENETSCPFGFLFPKKWSITFNMRCTHEWIPFFENSILTLSLIETNFYGKTGVKEIDGVLHKIQNYFLESQLVKSGYEDDVANEEAPPNEIVEKLLTKFKDTPIPPNELRDELVSNDFVIFQEPGKNSFSKANAGIVLAQSFRRNNMGRLEVEIDRLVDGTGDVFRRVIKLKLKDIILADKIDKPLEPAGRVVEQMANEIINKLAQTCYTVRVRRTYFNKGLPPCLMGDPALANILRKVDRTSFSSIEDVYKYIDDFITEDTDIELVFGPDFSEEERNSILKYVKNPKLDYRTFKSTEKAEPDHVAVCIKRSPQYIRDMIKKDPLKTRYKYFMVPPAGDGADFKILERRISSKLLKEESRINSYYNEAVKKGSENIDPFEEWLKKRIAGSGTNRTDSTKPAVSRLTNGMNRKRPGATQLEGPGAKRGRFQPSGKIFTGPPMKKFSPYGGKVGGTNNAQKSPRFSMGPTQYTRGNRQIGRGGRWASNQRNRLHEYFDQRGGGGLQPSMPAWGYLQPLVMVWPINSRSHLETRARYILEANFPTQFVVQEEQPRGVAAVITLKLQNGTQKDYCLAVEANEINAARVALDIMLSHCTVIKPNPTFLCEGGTPDFVRYKLPCKTNPRTYIIMGKRETGQINEDVLAELFQTFRNSLNEDLFFDAYGYSYHEKMLIMNEAQRYGLNARHFGEGNRVVDHYVCVYKTKPKKEILGEVLKMRGYHPKYVITTDRLPRDLSFNTY